MPVPKKRHSNTWQRTRRASNWKISGVNLGECPECHAPVLPHHACPTCGLYQGRKAIEIKEKSEKEKKLEAKEASAEKASHKEAERPSKETKPKTAQKSTRSAKSSPQRVKKGAASAKKEG